MRRTTPEQKLEKQRAQYAANAESRRESQRRRYAANREDRRAKQRQRYGSNPEPKRERERIIYANDPEKKLAQTRGRYAENIEEERAKDKARRGPYKDKIRAQAMVNYFARKAADPDKVRNQQAAAARIRRARKVAAPINDFSDAQWQEMLIVFDSRCAYCDRQMQRLTQDHITPYEKGGSNTLWNIVPACLSCNSKKKTGPPLCPVQPLLLTIAPARKPRIRKGA